MTNRRARSDEDKAARLAEILDAARSCFDVIEVDRFTMDDVAAKLGLAKGTLYRYVPTREALLLALVSDEYAQWFDSLDAFLAARTWQASARFVDHVVDSLLAQPRLLRLVSVMPSVLERNIPVDTARSFKATLLQRCDIVADAMAARLGIGRDAALQLLVHLQAGVVGLYHHANPAPVVREALDAPEFAGMAIDLRDELTHLVRALLAAAR
jgi:TetR/AcrR family transcriptional regulator